MIITYNDFYNTIKITYTKTYIEIFRNITDICYYLIKYYRKEYENDFKFKSLAIIYNYCNDNNYKKLFINYNDIFMIYKVKYFDKIINSFYLYYYNKKYSRTFNHDSFIFLYKKYNRLINYKVNNYIN